MVNELERLVVDEFDIVVVAQWLHHLAVEVLIDVGRSGNRQLVALMSTGSGNHRGQVVANLLATRTGHQRNDGLFAQQVLLAELLERTEAVAALFYLLHGGVAHIGHLVIMFGIESRLEWQNGVHVVDILLDALHAILLPRPHLGRDEVEHRYAALVGILCHLEVKRRVVDQDKRVGAVGGHALLGCLHEAQDAAQVLNHLDETHECHVAVVNQRLTSGSVGHQVAAQKGELRLTVVLLERLD